MGSKGGDRIVTPDHYEARIRALLNVLHTIANAKSLPVIREMALQAISHDGLASFPRSETERGMD